MTALKLTKDQVNVSATKAAKEFTKSAVLSIDCLLVIAERSETKMDALETLCRELGVKITDMQHSTQVSHQIF